MTYINVFKYRDELNTELAPCSTIYDSATQALDYDEGDFKYEYTLHVFYVDGEPESKVMVHDLTNSGDWEAYKEAGTLTAKEMGIG